MYRKDYIDTVTQYIASLRDIKAEVLAEPLRNAINKCSCHDFWGTEGQLDPRGDMRDVQQESCGCDVDDDCDCWEQALNDAYDAPIKVEAVPHVLNALEETLKLDGFDMDGLNFFKSKLTL